ncbi:MAG: carbon-nitrogen hydrolase family protein [bacterium]|nr:carbon-nitrogen hydrolase family protein [bacterium]
MTNRMRRNLGLVLMILNLAILPALSSNCGAEAAESPDGSLTALRIAVVQADPSIDFSANLTRAMEYCREAKRKQADLVLFPEMFSVGYQTAIDFESPDEVAVWKGKAQSSDGSFTRQFSQLARELEVAIAITYLEDRNGSLRNATSLIDRHGELLFTYAKVHTCRFFPMEGSLVPGDEFYVAPLDTRLGPVHVGVMTCYDREFPESARVLMLKGAEVILTPNACGLDELRLKQFQVRAWENSVATVMANYASGQGNGRSCAYAADGRELLLADQQAAVYIAEIDLTELRRLRERTFWGAAWRRPGLYKPVTEAKIQAPFHRIDAFNRPNSQDLSTP